MSTTVSYKGETIATVSNQTKTLTTEGKYLEDDITLTDVSSSSPTLQTKSVSYSPTTSQQTATVTADNGYDALSQVNVTVAAMPSGTVTAPASISGSSASVSTGTNTLTLSKTVSVTPTVSTAGYVSSGTAGNSSVSLTASVTTKGATTYHPSTTDQSIASGTYTTGTQTIKAVTLSNLTAGNIKSGVTVKVGDSTDDDCVTSVLGTYEGSGGITPTGNINITQSGETDVTNYATATVAAQTLPTSTSSSATSGYTSKATISRSTSDQYINIPTGFNNSGAYYKVNATPNGTVTAPSTISGTNATLTYSTNTLSLSKSVSVTPNVTTAGYISSGTTGSSTVNLTASVPTVGASTFYPSTSDQSIVSGKYLTGNITFKGVEVSNTLIAENIKNGVTVTIGDSADADRITSVTGTYSAGGTPAISIVDTADSGGGDVRTITALDISDTTATASDVASGKYFYASDGTKTQGTASGGITPTGNINITSAGQTNVTNYATATVAAGTATAPASISGTSATVSTGTNTLTLSKTVSVTPNVSTAGYISSGTAGNSSVSLTASVTTKGATTYYPSTSDQTIASDTYTTGTQTIKGVAVSNTLTASNIKNGVTITIGDSSDADRITSVTGTYEGGGGGSGMTVGTATTTPASASSSISFTGLSGEPTSFVVMSAAELTTGASPYKTAAVVFDGTNIFGQRITNTSNANANYDGTGFSKTYSNGTLTITGTGTNFQAVQYKLVYSYGGNSANIATEDVQVGSGATSITFTGLSDEPTYFSCVFKSDFGTSSGYQRVIGVVFDGTSTYGMELDSSAKASTTDWSYSYSSGSLTITSSGTNAGGYFHQPGYYQLTYGIGGDINIDIEPLNVTTNGVYSQSGKAYSPVTVAVPIVTYYTGSSTPASALGSNGDIYLQTS